MNLDSIGNTFAASFGSVKRVIPRVDEKKSRSKENTDEFRSVPAKYALPQPMQRNPIVQLGIASYARMAAGRVQACRASIPVLRAQSVHRVLSRRTWIRGMRLPKGTTAFYYMANGKKKLWGLLLVRKQIINGIKCGPGYVIFNPNHRGRPVVEYVEKLSHDRYVKSRWGLIKCAKNTSLGINRYGQARGATLAKPLVLSKDLKLPIGSRVHLITTPHYVAVTLGKKIRYKGLLLDKGDKLFFSRNKNRKVSSVYIRKPHVIKGVNCNVGRTIYYKLNGNVKSVKCHTYPKRQQGVRR